ncbi:MAG: Bacterial domain [Candidatus Paceibacter sp.]|jgi:membrane protein YdbS with pleckstrin-like domain|nr:Bacterial domain [Candidatus Paceibacter sp.]
MFELEKKYKGGKKTLLYLFFKKGWVLALIGLGFLYLSYAIYFGNLNTKTVTFLASHEDWYVSVGMLALWLFLIGISFIFVGYLNASVHYRYYKFMLDKHAVHLHRGWFFIRETTIPYHQISNVHIARPYHYRMMGLAQLDIVTAADKDIERIGQKSKTFLMPIIDIVIARNLSKFLLEASAKSRHGKYADDEPISDSEDEEDIEDSADTGDDDDFDDNPDEKQYVVIHKNSR